MKNLVAILVLFGLFVLAVSSTFVVREWDQVLVVELGKVMRTEQEPGFKIKKPFIQSVVRFDKRLLEYDAMPRELLTADKQQVIVDNYSRWKIVDPQKFYETVRNEAGAQSRLDDIIYSAVREKLGRHTMQELVSGKRSELMEKILKESRLKSKEFGIEIEDVRIKRADLPQKNEENVYARMRAEREREAKKFRAEGDEQARIIRSEAEREARVIVAKGKKEAEIIRGRGDGESTKIFARAYNQDPDFYSFTRSLETYRKVFKDGATVLLSPDDDMMETFRTGK